MSAPANIGPDGVRFRMFFAVLFFCFTLMMTALLTVTGAPVPLRMFIFIPAWISALCTFQALSRTCVFLAARGACSTQMGTRPIEDEEQRQYFVRRAGRVHLQALATALLLTLTLVAVSISISWRLPPAG